MLHEDNRYVLPSETGFWNSRFGSAAGAAFISRVWQPHSTDSAGDGADQFGIIIGADVGRNMFHEFWPDMKRHLHMKRKE